MTHEHLPLFVYGTLKRGESREGKWPFAPLQVSPATTQAALYDLGPYPALGPGDDVVAGELWFLREEDVAETLRQFDAIEGYQQGGPDLYVRRVIDCRDADGAIHQAYAYFYANPHWLLSGRRVSPNVEGLCRWSAQERSK
jgi:gamma-glutamylcyclotransferase (GGCT)/AIG2-like uncharacterized protein YtfP